MPKDELPTLPHEIASPEEFLPGTPLWLWIAIAGGALIIVLGLICIIRKITKNPQSVFQAGSTNPYHEAHTQLSSLAENHLSRPLALVASDISLILRACISRVLDDPALFETSEEQAFRLRSIAGIPSSMLDLLHQLASVKYGPSFSNESEAQSFIEQAKMALQDFKHTREEQVREEAAQI